MKTTTVSVYRAGALVAGLSGIQAQIQQINLDMESLDGGAADYDSFMVYCPWANPDIHRNDILQDEASIGDNYEVVNKPEQFPNGMTKCKATLKWGT